VEVKVRQGVDKLRKHGEAGDGDDEGNVDGRGGGAVAEQLLLQALAMQEQLRLLEKQLEKEQLPCQEQ
jgi:hypothetical protein